MGLYSDQQSGIEQKIVFEELVLSTKRPPLFALLILGFFTTVFILFVPTLIVVLVSFGGIRPGHFFGIAIAVIPGAFFLRLLLWNLYGREVIRVEPDGIRSFCDYKYFIGGKKHLSGSLFYIDIIESEHPENQGTDWAVIDELTEQAGFRFGIRNDEGMILSHFSIPLTELDRFKNRVNSLEEGLPKIKWSNEELV